MENTKLHITDTANELIPFPCLCIEPKFLAKIIYEKYSQATVLLINVNFKTDGVLRSQNAGIELLKYLRLYNFRQHCVLYSFLSREQLIEQDPRNLIIFSAGVTFIRLPYDFSKFNFDELAKKTAPEDLSAYLKAESSLPDDRHFAANWWGVLQLWNVQKAVEKIADIEIISNVEHLFIGSLKEMNSYQGLLARYLKKIPISDIERHLSELSERKIKKFGNEEREKNEIKQEIKSLSDHDIECDIQIQILKETLAEFQQGFFKKILAQINNYPSTIQREIEEIQGRKKSIKKLTISDQKYIDLTELIEKEKDKIYESQHNINRRINSKISILEKEKSFTTNGFSLEKMRSRLCNEKPSIVYVDDQAKDGWAAIFQRMIYGGDSDSFSVIQPIEMDTIDEISLMIRKKIKESKAKLLILDLRLKREKGSITDVSKVSGIQVLEKLKEAKISCPVLITTASNKVWSYKETFASGTSAYWIKEGLDEKVDIETTVDNYLRFIDLVYLLCFSDEFTFLYVDFQNKINGFEIKDSIFWWETKFWGDKKLDFPKTNVTNKEEVLGCLYQAFQLFEDYLKLKIQNTDNARLNNNIASLIVLQCARILEIIHKVDRQKAGTTLSDKMKDQLSEDFFNYWSKLLFIRNEGAHSFNADFEKLKTFILLLFEYLNTDISNNYLVENERYLMKEPIEGNLYESTILSKHKDFETYYLKNPELNLLNEFNNILLDKRFNKHLDSQPLEVGMKIKFKLKIIGNTPSLKYTAIESEILN